jgi:N-acetylmuramic acid 6-phosphate etherase
MISTIVMVRLGKTYGNLMIDMKVTNHKLRARAERTVMRVAEVSEDAARRALELSGNSIKQAIVQLRAGLDAAGARELLEAHDGVFRAALKAAETNR